MSKQISDIVEENHRLQELNAMNFSEKMRLRRENNKLREALKHFSDKANQYVEFADHVDVGLSVGELRAAEVVYKETGNGENND